MQENDGVISIGDFARLGQVSVRMLRHYDSIGLLVPAGVDPSSGYRRYAADGVGSSWQALARWVEGNGWSTAGPGRENYVRAEPADDQSGWVTELQQPVVRV